MKPATLRRMDEIGRRPGDGNEPFQFSDDGWKGILKAKRIGMVGTGQKGFCLSILHDLTRIHDYHPVTILRHNGNIMGDENHGVSQLPLKLKYLLQNRILNDHIEGRRGFIGNDQEMG